jgi:hypothetical protein
MNFIKKWIAKIAHDGLNQLNVQREMQRANKLHDMFENNMAAMVAFKIDNGYVVRCMNPDTLGAGERVPGFTYCADHQAIADHLVSSAMRDRLGVQQDMFADQRKQVNVVTRNKTAGLVGAQQANPSY